MNEFDRLFAKSGLSLDRLRSFLQVAEAGNLANAASGDVTRQSQFSRQIKELDTFFGIALTRRVGRRIEITPEGMRLAGLIRRHFGELDDFREAMNGRPVCVRIGSQGSVIEWLVVPKLAECRTVLGEVILELEQQRSADIVRGVADGRLDFGIVRDDAVGPEVKRWKLGRIGYALFANASHWRNGESTEDALRRMPVGELLPGGQFGERLQSWLAEKRVTPKVVARMSSFTDLARLVRSGQVAAVLPEIAKVDLREPSVLRVTLPDLRERQLVLIANARSLDRSGLRTDAPIALAKILAFVTDAACITKYAK